MAGNHNSGRKSLFDRPMTATERYHRFRIKRRGEHPWWEKLDLVPVDQLLARVEADAEAVKRPGPT